MERYALNDDKGIKIGDTVTPLVFIPAGVLLLHQKTTEVRERSVKQNVLCSLVVGGLFTLHSHQHQRRKDGLKLVSVAQNATGFSRAQYSIRNWLCKGLVLDWNRTNNRQVTYLPT